MKTRPIVLTAFAACLFGSYLVRAQNNQPAPPMGFFVTSTGLGRGGNLGGLEGADRHCQALAKAAGAGSRTWHAFLSASPTGGQGIVNARDRIGRGPWHNAKGDRVAEGLVDLLGDTMAFARVGNNLNKRTALTERGDIVSGFGDTPNRHDILTGSQPDGRAYTDGVDHTCQNWTSSGGGTAQVGHSDRTGGGSVSWNSTHATRGCSQDDLRGSGGDGLFYCFAID
jgi:hypothetical protein